MARTSTKVFVLEVMGRHAGWMAAAGGLAGSTAGDAPHIILFPEIAFDKAKFLAKVQKTVEKLGYCVVVVSEGVRDADGKFLAEAGTKDAFGHSQLGGVGPIVAQMTQEALGYKFHWAVADYLQSSGAAPGASKVDVEQAYAVGKAAVQLALRGKNAVMPVIVRKVLQALPLDHRRSAARGRRQQGKESAAQLHQRGWLRYHRPPAVNICSPSSRGEDYPPYRGGVPAYVTLKGTPVPKRLATPFLI